MDCYSCDHVAINACKRCAKPYCEDHGNVQYCSDCLKPASALPSFNLYRGSLLVMLVATALAVYLIVRPPGETKGALAVVGRSTATATAENGQGQRTVEAQTPAGTTTPAGTPTPDISLTPTVSPFIEYVVQDGDSLYAIAEANLPPGDDVTQYAIAIANLNGFTVEEPLISVGETLLLPRPAAP